MGQFAATRRRWRIAATGWPLDRSPAPPNWHKANDENLYVRGLRLRLRRGEGVAAGRNQSGYALGGHPGKLEMPRVRRGEKRLRDDRNLIPHSPDEPSASHAML